MPYDALQTLYRGSPSASVNGDPVFLGANRGARVTLRVGGDVTGTNPTFDWKIERSAAQSGSAWTLVATGAQVTDEMVGYIATATPRYEVPGEDPLFLSFSTSEDYVRVVLTLGGTSPVFNGVTIEMEADDRAFVRSGR